MTVDLCPPSASYSAEYSKIDDVVAELMQKCSFCGEPFRYTSDRIWNNSGEYSAKGWEIHRKTAQIDIYLVGFGADTSAVESSVEQIYSKRRFALETKLQKVQLDAILLGAARNRGVEIEKEVYEKVRKIVTNLIPTPRHYIGDYDYTNTYYSPKAYKCHKACWPKRKTFVAEELLQMPFGALFLAQIENLPKEYISLANGIKKVVVQLSKENYDPFKD